MRKWIAFTLSLVLIFMASVPAFATSSIVGKLVDSDGDIASDRYDTIRPGADYYYVIAKSGTGYDSYVDEDLIRFKLQKEEGRKYIGDADLVEKKFGSSRYICIEFSVKDNFSDEEYKAVLEANFRARKDLVITNATSYNAGLAFPKFRRATSSDGSYTDADIQAARDAYNTAISDRDKLKSDIEQLKKDIADLERQIAEQKTQDSQQQDKVDAAKQELDLAEAELARLVVNQTTAQTAYEDAVQKLTEAVAKDEQDYKDKLAKYNEAKQPLAEALEQAENNKTASEEIIKNANDAKAEIETLKAELAATISTPENPTPAVPQTLKDYFVAYNNNPTTETANDFNNKLATYQTSAGIDVTLIPALQTSPDNVAAVTTALDTEMERLENLIADQDKAITDENKYILTVEAEIHKQTLAIQNLGDEPTLNKSQEQLDAEDAVQTAQSTLTDANNAVTAQQAVVKTAENTVLGLTTKAPADTTLEQQLAAKKVELTNKQADLRIKENAVTDAKEALDDKLAGTGDNVLESGETFTYTFKVYIQNEHIVDDDATFTAGEKGVVVKPVKNEINTVTWEDHNRTLATLSFRADSDVSFYCPRLSTRWNYYDYEDYFEDTDAYVFDFVDSPTIPATTRPTLSLYNPFVDEDGDLTIRTSRIHIYEVDDGELEDVTDDFRFEKNDDDDYVMTIKTRTLGTYIVSEGRANIAERPTIEVDYDDDDLNTGSSNSSGGGNSVVNNKKPVPWTGR